MTERGAPDGVERLRLGLRHERRLLFRRIGTFVLLSVAWTALSVPIVTIGPATLGAYAAIQSIRHTGRVDRDRIVDAIRQNGVHATLLGLVPTVLFGVVAINAYAYARTRSILLLAASVGALYAMIYAVLVLIPTFVTMSAGTPFQAALRDGHRWFRSNTTTLLTTALLTLATLVLSLAMTIAFVVLFPAVAFLLHVEVIDFKPWSNRNADDHMGIGTA